MGYKKSKKKLRKYIERDDFPKLKSYLTKHDVDLARLTFEDGDSLLHLACDRGLDHVVWFLLKEGADPLFRNSRQEIPLHFACRFALNESHYAYYDLVQPYMDKFPRSLYCKDEKGVTPRDLVREIRQKLSQKGANIQEDDTSADSASGEDWKDKIAGEAQAEYEQNWGTYEDDFADTREEDEPESYSAWSERMHQEMSHKRRKEWEERNPGRKKQKTKEEEEEEEYRKAEFQRKLEREHEEYTKKAAKIRKVKMISRKSEYELACAKVFQKDASKSEDLGYCDIPWPTPSNWDKEVESMKEFLLCDIDEKDKNSVKKYLKDQQVRWHPDRFQQKVGNRLKVKDTERIMDKVKLISQILNRIITEMSEN